MSLEHLPSNWYSVEYVSSILEYIRNIYRVYWKLSGMSTEYSGMCLEFLPIILELVWNVYPGYWNVYGITSEYTGIVLNI